MNSQTGWRKNEGVEKELSDAGHAGRRGSGGSSCFVTLMLEIIKPTLKKRRECNKQGCFS